MVNKIKKYLEFMEVNNRGKKTKIFNIHNNTGWQLGQIRWFPAWRKYCFLNFDDDTWYDSKCLQEIIDFLNKLNK